MAATIYLLYKLISKPSPFRGLPGPPPQSWATGNLGQLFTPKGLPFHLELTEKYGGVAKIHGFFGDEQLYISDPQALHSIVLKDQESFEETEVFTTTNRIIFGPGLVSTTGAQHKKQRKLANPIFAPSNVRKLVPVFYEIADRLTEVLVKECERREILDMSEWMSRVALETVGQTVLGHTFDPLNGPNNNHYTQAIKELIPTIFSLSLLRQFAPLLVHLPLGRRAVEWIPSRRVKKLTAISDVMHNTAVEILRRKREQPTETGLGKDIISMMLEASSRASAAEQMSDAELTGQMTVLIFGAQDTTSSLMSRILCLLAEHPDIQERLREEVTARDCKLYMNNEDKSPLLDAVINETLRLYPPVPFVRRSCIKDQAVPRDKGRSTIFIPSGTIVFIGIAAANRLESVFGPDAKEWIPDRWLKEDHPFSQRLPGIHANMMSFLGGNRSCIGYRFALVEMKILLSTLLARLKFSPSPRHDVVWNLSQIISPSVKEGATERKGMPLKVEALGGAT